MHYIQLRNGRCAYQFARDWVGLQLLSQDDD